MLAHKQIMTELNSTTDNPLIDVAGNAIHHGGNFQAASVTSAMEKSRLSLQMIGKLLFAQCTELINPMLNNGLSPNLSADEPSLSFTCKGIDTSMAAYMSELAFLANPVSNHVQSAEMHNQAINSLALISARYTLQSAEIVGIMASAHIYVLCQALDLRSMLANFFMELRTELADLTRQIWSQSLEHSELAELELLLWEHIRAVWSSNATLDSEDRAKHAADSALSVVTDFLISSKRQRTQAEQSLSKGLSLWKSMASSSILKVYTTCRSRFFDKQDTIRYLGKGSRVVYHFVRETLGVPFNQGLTEHPRPDSMSIGGRSKKNIGSWISTIHESISRGTMYEAIMAVQEEERQGEPLCAPAIEVPEIGSTLERRVSQPMEPAIQSIRTEKELPMMAVAA